MAKRDEGMSKEEKLKRMNEALSKVQKRFGKDTVKLASDDSFSDIDWWELSSPNLSDLMGKGLPKGRIVELFGAESSGKSSVAQYLAGEVQRQGGLVAYIDMENAVEPSWGKTLGFNLEEAIIAFPNTQEDALDLITDLVEAKAVDLIILDSVASMVPNAELSGESISEAQMGLAARNNNKFLRKIVGPLSKNNITLLAINQIREKIAGFIMGENVQVPGGLGWRFASSIRLQSYKKETLISGGEPNGILTRIKSKKNKVGIPFRDTLMKLIYHKGFQVEEEWIDFAVKYGVIEKGGSWFTLPNLKDKLQGKERVIAYLKANPDDFSKIKESTKLFMTKNKPIEDTEIKEEEVDPETD